MRIIPLGGLGEIGMNCLVLESENDLILIDCGIQFPDSSFAGVDLLTPDLSYVRERLGKLRGVVVTHGHDDHIGAIPFLARETELDVYATPFPTGLLRQKLDEVPDAEEVTFHEVSPRQVFTIGDFRFDPISVQHSIIESLAYAIETPFGTLIHSGDFKHDPNLLESGGAEGFAPFQQWGDKGVLGLFSDSTNAERTGHTLSENDITSSFENIFKSQTGRLFIALFASNIKRIENLLWIANAQGKKVALAGRSMHSYTRLAHEQKTIRIPEETLVLLEDIHQYPDNKVTVLLTGSQAEPRSALVRIAQNTHRDVKIRPGDTIIMSSRFIPGNERNITAMIDQIYRMGAEVTYESFHQIHVSGHGFQDELMMMLNSTRPTFFVPIHGEYRHLAKHSKLAKKAGVKPDNVFVIEDGQILEVTRSAVALGERLDLRKGVVVEGTYMEASANDFSQKGNLSRGGVVYVGIAREPDTLRLVGQPKVGWYGVLLPKSVDPEEFRLDAQDFVEEIYEDAADSRELEEFLRLEVRRFFRKHLSYKPVVIPVIVDA